MPPPIVVRHFHDHLLGPCDVPLHHGCWLILFCLQDNAWAQTPTKSLNPQFMDPPVNEKSVCRASRTQLCRFAPVVSLRRHSDWPIAKLCHCVRCDMRKRSEHDVPVAIQTPGTELLGLWGLRPCWVMRVRAVSTRKFCLLEELTGRGMRPFGTGPRDVDHSARLRTGAATCALRRPPVDLAPCMEDRIRDQRPQSLALDVAVKQRLDCGLLPASTAAGVCPCVTEISRSRLRIVEGDLNDPRAAIAWLRGARAKHAPVRRSCRISNIVLVLVNHQLSLASDATYLTKIKSRVINQMPDLLRK